MDVNCTIFKAYYGNLGKKGWNRFKAMPIFKLLVQLVGGVTLSL